VLGISNLITSRPDFCGSETAVIVKSYGFNYYKVRMVLVNFKERPEYGKNLVRIALVKVLNASRFIIHPTTWHSLIC